jgi:phosphoglycolate phosphatase-like HAD superfamily hydrolase
VLIEHIDRVILWDVDGTLVRTGGVGADAFNTAIETLFGVPAGKHGVSLAGKTDPQIAREILTVLDLHDDADNSMVAATVRQFGPPVERRDFNRYTVLVYDHNLLVGLHALCGPDIAPSMADCERRE